MARNKRGQVVSIKMPQVKINKHLQEIADEAAIRIRPIIRDELEQTLREEIYASYTPATKSGKETQEYNESHKHQKSRPYHHTGILASSIYANIEGNLVQAYVRDTQYPDGTSATKVYDILKYGTPKTSTKKGFYYNNHKEFSPYIHQEPHNFETRTRERMDMFLEQLTQELQTEKGKQTYSRKYKNKRV